MRKSIIAALCLSFITLVSGSSSPLSNPNVDRFKANLYTVISSAPHTYASNNFYPTLAPFNSAFTMSTLAGVAAFADVFSNLNFNTVFTLYVGTDGVNTTHFSFTLYGDLANVALYKVSLLGYDTSIVNGQNIMVTSTSVPGRNNVNSNTSF